MRDDNPVRGVERFADGKRERRLSEHGLATSGVYAMRQLGITADQARY
jgi:hypothetical protein